MALHTGEEEAAGPQRPPLASLTLAALPSRSAASARAARRSASRAAVAVRSVPALRAAPHASTSGRGAAAAGHAAGQQQARQQQQHSRGGGFRPWRVPLAAGGLLLGLARSAASHVLAPGLPAPPAHGAAHDSRVFPSLLPKRVNGGGGSPPGVPGGRKPALLWLRSDLRLHDHAALEAANASATSLLPVYVFDPREYAKTHNGFDKTGPYRARFILDSLADLRSRLRDAGSELVVRIGRPEEVLPQLARAVGAGAVHCHGEVTAEEVGVESAVARALDKAGAALKVHWGGTLFHVGDLPFQLAAMPPHYSQFRSALAGKPVREPLPAPAQIKGLPAASVPAGELPSLQQLGFDAAVLSRVASDSAAAGSQLRGGESEALRRLSEFVSAFTRRPPAAAGAAAADSSRSGAPAAARSDAPSVCCKVSPWLALGCLSPRQLYAQLQREAGTASGGQRPQQQPPLRAAGQEPDADMQWLLFELLWRDFFRFVTKKHTLASQRHAKAGAAPVPAMAMA